VTKNHSYRQAPEPLFSLQSHFQVLHSPSGNCLFLYLSNISSQHIRRNLFERILRTLKQNHLRPTTTWMQICNTTYPTIAFQTRTAEEVLTAITTAQTKLGMIRIPDHQTVLPWTIPDIEILMHHPCGHREERALPERMNPQTAAPSEEEADVTTENARNAQLKKIMMATARKRRNLTDEPRSSRNERRKRTTSTTEETKTCPIPGPSRLPPGQEHYYIFSLPTIRKGLRR
jgi:hypothetical protein